MKKYFYFGLLCYRAYNGDVKAAKEALEIINARAAELAKK